MHNSDLKKWCLPHSGSNLVVTTKTQMAVIEYRRDLLHMHSSTDPAAHKTPQPQHKICHVWLLCLPD